MENIQLHTISFEKGALSYRISGSGPMIFFLHGLGGASKSWLRQLEGLQDEFTVVAWDTPGYGKSERRKADVDSYADAALELLEALKGEDVTVVGHSMGGVIAGRMISKDREMIKRVVLSSTFAGEWKDPEAVLSEGFQQRIHELDTMSRRDFGLARAKSMTSDRIGRSSFEELAGISAEIEKDGYVDACKVLNWADNREGLRNVQIPVLILEAEEDTIIAKSEGDKLAALIPHAERRVIQGAGHAPYMEKPLKYNLVLKDFIQNCEV